MSEVSSSLVVAEKKPPRPGGCVGIFFQLFDWNRRLAKKKLFSKKLLPPDRAKRAVKKFGGDDKLPTAKLLLINEENRGGFPNGKKSGVDGKGESSREMRSPSLVARLMGLESMPAVYREKAKKCLTFENGVGHGSNQCNDGNVGCSEQFVCDREEFRMGKGHGKIESRPQKLQKTGLFERRAVTRFGAEALQFKSVISRSRKQHQPKLASPVKSPRVGRNASRLMGAATRILEPGVHASNRAKCALTYAPTSRTTSRDEFSTQRPPIYRVEESREHDYYPSVSKQPKGQPSCKSCGNWLDVVDSRSNVEDRVEASPALGLGNVPPLGPGRSKMKQETTLLHENEGDNSKYQGNRRRSKSIIEKKHVFREYQEHYHHPSPLTRYQNEAIPSTSRTPRAKRQSQISPKDRDNVRPRLHNVHNRSDPFVASSAHGAKEFVSVNGNTASRTKSSVPSKTLHDGKISTQRDALEKKDVSFSRLGGSVPKKRALNGRIQVENENSPQSTTRKHQGSGNNVVGKPTGFNRLSKERNLVNSETSVKANSGVGDSKKAAGVISFTFSSPMRHNTDSLSPTTLEKGRGQMELNGDRSSPKKKLAFGVNTERPSSRLATHLRGDALGALLEEKLKELTCRDRDELETGDGPSGRSTAVILEELIHALTAERPASPEDGDSCSIDLSHDDSSSYASRDALNDTITSLELIADHKVQPELKSPLCFVGFPLGGDGARHSPGSVLDASFSNDSCFSESLDGHSERKLHSESMDRSYSQPQPSEYHVEFSDCSTLITTKRTGIDTARETLKHIQSVLYGDHDTGFVGSKLSYATEVIVNADLLCGPLFESHTTGKFPIALLLDKLEGLYDSPCTTPNFQASFIESKDECQWRRFLLDCIIEFLDSQSILYSKSLFKGYAAHPLEINGESLTMEVHEEIQRWSDLAGKTSDEILEREMNHSLGKWVDFEMEAFEIGEKIGFDILQLLVNEVVIDLEQNSMETMFLCSK